MTGNQFNRVTEWQRATFPNANAFAKIAHLAEELQELLVELKQVKEHIDLDAYSRAREEFADCFILLFGAADCAGMSYLDILIAIDKKMEKNLLRKWGDPDEDGVVRHIKS